MLASILALAQRLNWDRFFAPCWNWDVDVPILARCSERLRVGLGFDLKFLNGVPCSSTGHPMVARFQPAS